MPRGHFIYAVDFAYLAGNSQARKPRPIRDVVVTLETACNGYQPSYSITQVTFTEQMRNGNIRIVVWQFWGRAAEAP